ncbi:MAG: YdeI family protein [Pseudohongiellaceae bacterium]
MTQTKKAAAVNDNGKIEAYIDKHKDWEKQLRLLRKTLLACEVNETVKWGSPAYTVAGATIISLVAFKNHIALWFHQGVFLKDSAQQLINAQEGVTKALRQWRFSEADVVDTKLVKQYAQEAIQNQLAGKMVKPSSSQKEKILKIPAELAAVMNQDKKIAEAFAGLTPGRQKEYVQHIESAKQEKTRLARVEKAVPIILSGVGLNDKYKNC